MRYMKFLLIVSVFIFSMASVSYAQGKSQNIFEPKIPRPQVTKESTPSKSATSTAGGKSSQTGEGRSGAKSARSRDIPQAPEKIYLNVEGLIWGTIIPKAIIDGEIYSEGDRVMIDSKSKEDLPDSDAVIRKIDKLGVHVEYAGRMYTVSVVDNPSGKKKKKNRDKRR